MTDKLNQNQQPELSENDAELLSAYIDEMLPAGERRNLEARLENEPFLRAELIAMRQTVAWMNNLPILKAPRDFTISATDIAQKEIPIERKVIPMQNRNWWLAASAAAIIVVMIGLVAILPALSNTNFVPIGADIAAESIALRSTELAPEAESRTETNDNQAASSGVNTSSGESEYDAADGALSPLEAEPDFSDDSYDVAEDESVDILENSASDEDVSRSNDDNAQVVPLAAVQQTATSLANLFLMTPTEQTISTASFSEPALTQTIAANAPDTPSDVAAEIAPLSVAQASPIAENAIPTALPSLGQGGGVATTSIPSSTPFALGVTSNETALVLPTSTALPTSANVAAVAESTESAEEEVAEDLADNEASDFAAEAESSLVDSATNIIRAFLNVMRLFAEEFQP